MSEIKGIIPPLVTPLLDEDRLDVGGLEALIEHVLAGGVHGLFILGTTGEGPSLSYAVREELIERVCEQVGTRVPVLVGITDSSLGQAVHVAEAAARHGARALVWAPPFYFGIDQRELCDFANRLIDAVDLPLFLYDNPALTGVPFELDTVRTLIQRPEVVGFKDSSGDASRFHTLRTVLAEADVPVFVGPEALLAETLIMGGDGGVSGGANVFPELYVRLYQAVQAGNIDEALILHQRIVEVGSVLYSGSAYGSSRVINGIKRALAAMDICSDYLATPLAQASSDKARKIEAFLAREWESSGV